MYPEINLNFYQFPSSVNVNHDALASLAISKSPDVDIFGIDTIWVQEFGAMGWCEPLNVHFPTLSASFVDTGLNIFSYRGQRLGIPIWMSTGGLFFNQEILSSFGVNVPGSYDELFEAASSIIRRQPELSGFLWSGAEEESLVMCWAEFFLGFGGHYFDNKGYCTINSNAGIASLEFMIKLLDQGVSPRETVTWTPEEARNRFVSGQAAFLRHNFDLAVWLDNPARSHVGGKWGVTPNPAQPRGKRACITGGFALALNPYTQNLEHALRVLSIIASSEMQRGFANAWGPLQCHRDIYHGQIGATSGYNASLSRKLASAFAIRPPSVCYSDLSDILQEKLHGALLGKATPKQALNSACAQIDDLHLL
jgi:multiple sugar transport system substrate-binding protein